MRRATVTVLLACAMGIGLTACPVPDPSPGAIVVAAYGDSLTSDWEGPGSGYPSRLPAAWQKLNRGVFGELGATGGPRLRSAAASLYTDDAADAVVVMWGTNDLGWGLAIQDPELYGQFVRDPLVAAVRDAVLAVRLQGIDVVVCVPPPTANDTALLVARRAELRGIFFATFPPLGVPVVDFSTDWPPDLWLDGLHLNEAGKLHVAAAVADALTPFAD